MASSRQLVSECKACSTLLTFLRNLKLNFPHKDTSRRCWLCIVRLDDPLSQNEADHFADHKKNAFKCIRLHWEHHLKKQDYKNRYKIKLLRLTFCTAVLSFFFCLFFSFSSSNPTSCSVSPPLLLLTSVSPLIHQAAASIASQDYPIQHGVWEKTLVMADTLLISFN